jgi:hypothetical protein
VLTMLMCNLRHVGPMKRNVWHFTCHAAKAHTRLLHMPWRVGKPIHGQCFYLHHALLLKPSWRGVAMLEHTAQLIAETF